MRQSVQVKSNDDIASIVFTDLDAPEYLIEKDTEPDLTTVKVGITKSGEVRVRQVDFPKLLYEEAEIQNVANKIQSRFNEEGCRSCVAMAEVRMAKKSFILPTLKDLAENILMDE
jgi:hypothetical protein